MAHREEDKHGGVALGPKRKRSKYEKERDRKRNNQRSEVEGKFGEAKERYGMKELYTRLPQTTKAETSLILPGYETWYTMPGKLPVVILSRI